ncbi:MAG TPA: amidohydrolase family protein [Bacillota bacterium]
MATVIRGGTVLAWDGRGHVAVPGGVVLIEGGRIAYAGPEGRAPAHAAAEVIDATGLVVAPGFVNTHVHASIQATTLWGLDAGRRDVYGSLYLAYQPREDQGQTPLTPGEERDIVEFSLGRLLRQGSTTVVEMGSVNADPDLLAEVIGAIGIRAYTGPGFRSASYFYDQNNRLQYRWDHEAGRRGLQRALAFHDRWDGAFSGRLRAMIIPRNADTCPPELLREAHRHAVERGAVMQIHTAQHLIEFQEIMRRHGRTPVRFLYELGILGPHMTLGHCVYVSGHSKTAVPGDDDLEILAGTGTSVAHSPREYLRYGHILETFARYRRHGVNMTIGTDTLPQDMISEVRFASYLAKVIERDYAAATAEEVFYAATVGGARALQRDDLGRLAPGAVADVVLWDLRNLRVGPYFEPIKALVHCATGDDVDTVLVDGEVVVRGGRALRMTEERVILRRVQAIAEKVCRHRWPELLADAESVAAVHARVQHELPG